MRTWHSLVVLLLLLGSGDAHASTLKVDTNSGLVLDVQMWERPHGRAYAVPLLLISPPGLAAEVFTWDTSSLGSYFVRRGWRVYGVTLGAHVGATLETAAHDELEAVVRAVSLDAGTPPVVIGYSVAGSALGLWATRADHAPVRGAVFIGAPWALNTMADSVAALAQHPAAFDVRASLTTRARFRAPPAPLPAPPDPDVSWAAVLLSNAGVAPERAQALLKTYGAPIGLAMATDLGARVRAGGPISKADVHIDAPVFILAGSNDSLAPVWSAIAIRDQLRAPSIEFTKVGRQNFDRQEYGHLALIASKRAPRDVFKTLASWLEREVAR